MRDEEEVQVYCRSDWRIKREAAIVERRRSRFEEQIKKLVVNSEFFPDRAREEISTRSGEGILHLGHLTEVIPSIDLIAGLLS